MSIVQEFKEFAIKGNVIDMAVGIIIGAAFGKIVSSAVADVIMPPLGIIIGGIDFTNLKLVLRAATQDHPAVTLAYGNFLQQCVDFAIVAFAIFLLVKAINKLKRSQPPPPAAPNNQEVLLREIRDLLKEQKS